VDNYDGSLKEPTLLPVSFPNILVNPNQGIAVGMASNICSFNLKEVCDTTIAYLKNPDCDLFKTLLAPDFSTGGELIASRDALKSVYETGRGSFKVRSRYRVDKKQSLIEIYEIPYSTTAEAIIDKIIELIKAGKIKEITDLRDETDLSGLKITIDVKKSADPELLMNKLFKMTPLEDSFSCNFNVLIGQTPHVLGVRDILYHWTKFRMDCITRRIKYDINKMTHRLHLLEGLKKILLDIDKAIAIIRNTEKEADVMPNLMKGFGIDEIQAEYVADIKLRNLNREYILNRIADIEDLIAEIDRLEEVLRDEAKVKQIIIDELKEIGKKHGCDRRTGIISEDEVTEFRMEEVVEDYNLRIFLTEQGYLKKISAVSLRSSSTQKLKDEDTIVVEQESTNRAELILFSDRCNAYKIKLNDVPDCKASEWGHYLPNLISMEDGERIVYAAATNDYSGHMLFLFANGKGARVPLSAYETKTNRKKLVNAYSGKSPLVCVRYLASDIDMAAYSSLDKVLVFNTGAISVKTTKDTQGIQVMNMKKQSTLYKVVPLEEAGLTDPDYYRTKNIPATGYYLKDGDSGNEQISLF